MKTVIRATRRTAHSNRKCTKCGHVIQAGKRYEHTFSVEDGEAVFENACMICVNNRNRVHCGDDGGHAEMLRKLSDENEKAAALRGEPR